MNIKKFKVYGYIKKFIEKNRFFSWLFLFIIVGIVICTCIVFQKFPLEPNPAKAHPVTAYSATGKVWEIACMIMTSIYTFWFWFLSKDENGNRLTILDNVNNDAKQKTYIIVSIVLSVVLLIVASLMNIYLVVFGIGIFWHWISLILMVATFIIFWRIDNLVIDNHNDENVKKDFLYAKNNSDIPGIISFTFLAIYFLFLHKYPMELFFSGAIAFQMLLSSFVWANTDITNVARSTTT